MHVLHLDSGREMRGGQYQVLRLVARLGSGHTLLTPASGPLMRAALEHGIDAHPLSLWAIATHARQVALIHAHDARTHSWASSVPRCPVIVSRRVAFPVGASWMSRWKYKRPEHFLAVSEYVKGTLMAAGVPEDKITVVYDGVEIPAQPATGDRLIAPATADVMKGSDLVARAAAVGGFDIHFSDDLERDLPHAAALVYITRSEGLGSAAILAAAHGVPAVASNVGGLPEVVEHGKTGYLTDNDPQAIADAIRQVLARRDELAAAARRRAIERFTVDRMVGATLRAYGKVLGC